MFDENKKNSIYTTIQLIKDLYHEVSRFSFILAEIFPEKFKMSLTKVSLLWGYSETWLGRIKRGQRNSLDIKRKEKLSQLETILRKYLGWKAINCFLLIKKYRNKKISTFNFIDKLQFELGRIIDIDLDSNEIVEPRISIKLFSYILWGTETFIYEVKNVITGKSAYPNPNYKFSLENLRIFSRNLTLFLGEKARKCKEMIDEYKIKNPDLKEYSLEQTIIKNKHYFSKLRNINLITLKDIEVIYWYGFLCADGAVYKDGGRYVISFRLKVADKERIYRFAEVVGFDSKNVKFRKNFRNFRGRIIESERAIVRFGSKIMYEDIISQGFTSSHDSEKQIPYFVQNLIIRAKKEAETEGLPWWYNSSGKLALAWLLGLYDGDGNLKDNKYGLLTSGNKEFLNLIARTFECPYRAKSKGKPTGFSTNKSYYLRFGVDLFDAMLRSFENSMKRKRP